jgi:hypothetical protein
MRSKLNHEQTKNHGAIAPRRNPELISGQRYQVAELKSDAKYMTAQIEFI